MGDRRHNGVRDGRWSVMKLVVGYLATPGGADAVALGVRLARTLGAELELCIVLPQDSAATARVSVGGYDELLAEQAEKWLDRALVAVPDDVVARRHASFAESFADGLIQEVARLEADAIVVGGSGGGLVGQLHAGLGGQRVAALVARSGGGGGARYPRFGHRTGPRGDLRDRRAGGRGPAAENCGSVQQGGGHPLRLASLVALDPVVRLASR